jgi:exodeoxyribonuclease VII small subunit
MPKKDQQGEFTTFESEFERLGDIVSRLESGNIPLEEMLKLYEEGTLLAAKLTQLLKQAELKVQKLAKVHEELSAFETEPFEEGV